MVFLHLFLTVILAVKIVFALEATLDTNPQPVTCIIKTLMFYEVKNTIDERILLETKETTSSLLTVTSQIE